MHLSALENNIFDALARLQFFFINILIHKKNSHQHLCDGMACHGDDYQFIVCKTQNCPIDGNWGTWSSWHECSVTCGGGTQTSTRQCNDPPVLFGGQECPGENERTQNCNEQNCPSKMENN